MEELAFAYWRLAKWVDAADVEHKMAATSALRQMKKFLDENNIEIIIAFSGAIVNKFEKLFLLKGLLAQSDVERSDIILASRLTGGGDGALCRERH